LVNKTVNNRGAALLAVLWLVAGLSAIALTIANTVRGETERSSTESDGLKAYYLASGAIDRMLLYLELAHDSPGGGGSRPPRGGGGGAGGRRGRGSPAVATATKPGQAVRMQDATRLVPLDFPTGVALGEIIPETSKLDVNKATSRELLNLLVALGQDPAQAESIAAGIIDWRGGSRGGFTDFDQYYLSLTPSFQARHASIQEIEELLLVRGVTPDLFYGSETRDSQGVLTPRAGLRDCLSVFGSDKTFDVNTVEPAVMQAIGVPPEIASAIYKLRKTEPLRSMRELAPFRGQGQGTGLGRLRLEPLGVNNAFVVTLRATAQLKLPGGKLSDVRRTVSELVMFLDSQSVLIKPRQPHYHILRWYENAVPLQ
jgi:general secretion pathway protein K